MFHPKRTGIVVLVVPLALAILIVFVSHSVEIEYPWVHLLSIVLLIPSVLLNLRLYKQGYHPIEWLDWKRPAKTFPVAMLAAPLMILLSIAMRDAQLFMEQLGVLHVIVGFVFFGVLLLSRNIMAPIITHATYNFLLTALPCYVLAPFPATCGHLLVNLTWQQAFYQALLVAPSEELFKLAMAFGLSLLTDWKARRSYMLSILAWSALHYGQP